MSSPRVERVIAALVGETEQAVKVLVVQLTAELQETTPVDTGWARANWIPWIGTPPSSPVGTPDSPGSPPAPAAAVAGYKIEMGPLGVSNRVPYIRRLNDGSSTQAPRAFVEAAIARAVDQVVGA